MLHHRYQDIVRNPFLRNVSAVAAGTIIAQLITIAFAPFITRIYGPESFGILGTFSAALTVLTPIVTLSLPIAIVLPDTDKEALAIAKASVFLASIIAIATFFTLQTTSVLHYHQAYKLSSLLVPLPLAILFTAGLAVCQQWAIRKRQFTIRSISLVAHAIFLNATMVILGTFHNSPSALTWTLTIGLFFHTALLFHLSRKWRIRSASRHQILNAPQYSLPNILLRYKDFPLYRTPQDLLNAISFGLPIFALSTIMGPTYAGYYTLARMAVALPSNILAKAVGEVIYPKINDAALARKKLFPIVIKSTMGLAAAGGLPFLVVFIFAPTAFPTVFGAEWQTAGEYAKWLTIFLFFNFCNRPSVAAAPVLGIQREILIYEIVSTGMKALSLYLGLVLINDDIVAVALFSGSGAAAYGALIFWILRRTAEHDRNTNK